MSTRRPSWRGLIGGTVAAFAVIFAFLAGRVHAGADPALRVQATATPAPQDTAPDQLGDPYQYAPPGATVDPDPPTTHAS
jgi:hypothetical protein